MNKICKQLEGEISREIENLELLMPGDEKHTAAVESLAKLYKLRIEEIKAEQDFKEKMSRRKMEETQHDADNEVNNNFKKAQMDADNIYRTEDLNLKKEQLCEQIRDRYVRIGLEMAGLVLPLMFYATWMKQGFKFEESGTFTSTTFKGLFNKFKPTKK